MDFSLTDDQKSLRALVREILADVATNEHLQELEKQGWSVFDRPLWQKLATAGITGIAVPEAHGGGGLGFLELSLVFEEVGCTVAPVPAVPTLVCTLNQFAPAIGLAYPNSLVSVGTTFVR